MLVTVEEIKNYLRVDGEEDDELLGELITSSECICRGILRIRDISEVVEGREQLRTAVLYGAAYLYEHRSDADHHALIMTLRSLLTSLREEQF